MINTTKIDVVLKKAGKHQAHVAFDGGLLRGFVFDANSKYRIKQGHKLIANLWTNENGYIRKFKNYHEKLFVKVKFVHDLVDFQPTGLRAQLGLGDHPDATNPMLFVCKRIEERHVKIPILVGAPL